MSSIPPPTRTYRSISGGTPQRHSSITSVSSSSGGIMPPPPLISSPSGSANANNNAGGGGAGGGSTYPLRMAQSMTIDEMRHLHRRALQEAEAKRTELRLVLASRYRELVGSSDEVLRMKERAKELYDLIHALPELLEKLQSQQQQQSTVEETKDDVAAPSASSTMAVPADTQRTRRQLSELTRSVHRALDRNQVHLATTTLMQLFCLIATHTNEFALANTLAAQTATTLAPTVSSEQMARLDPALKAQLRMIYFQVQTLPRRILQSSRHNLWRAASYNDDETNQMDKEGVVVVDPAMGAERSAAALASLDLLSRHNKGGTTTSSAVDGNDRANFLIETYFESKAQLLGSLFNQLTVKAADQAEGILSKIVLILQHDAIVHPYEIFVLRKFPGKNADEIMKTLPYFDPTVVQMRCSKFLASHLPLIRTKVKSVLVSIAGTTASALGQIRQSLYDKTDGIECQKALNENPFCTWDQAVESIVDIRQVLTHTEITMTPTADRKFSLWSALFSQTFSSLVHSLLTTSFHSVHAKVVTTLQASLSQAPALVNLLPHEAYRNTLRIATDLDQSLLKVSNDAHELLVHAEEREESERRLRQSLYVQTCEILGRLLCEVRRIVSDGASSNDEKASDGTRELVVGRLCHFLKFRLKSLPTLLDQESSPAAVKSQSAGTAGMISYMDLESAFSLADDNDDGLISFAEAIEAAESAFSGSQFHGSEMLRGNLLLSGSSKGPREEDLDVTQSELMLLTARGLRHGTGKNSALGLVQKALDDLINTCFTKWADAALKQSVQTLSNKVSEFWATAVTTSDSEWKAVHGIDASSLSPSATPLDMVAGVSPQTVGFVMNAAFVLNRTTTPADSLAPVPSLEHAVALGISEDSVSTLSDTLRWTLLRRSLYAFSSSWSSSMKLPQADKANSTAIVQLYVDVTFIKFCYLERNQHGFGNTGDAAGNDIEELVSKVKKLLSKSVSRASLLSLPQKVSEKHLKVDEVCDLFMTSLLGARTDTASSVSAGGELDLSVAASSASTQPFCYTPLSSSRRFALLPIQSDRTLADLQLRGAYKKEKEEQEQRQETIGGSVMSSGLGFFSNILKKK